MKIDIPALAVGMVITGIVCFFFMIQFLLPWSYRNGMGFMGGLAITLIYYIALNIAWLSLTKMEYVEKIPDEIREMFGGIVRGEATSYLRYNAYMEFTALLKKDISKLSKEEAVVSFNRLQDLAEDMPDEKKEYANKELLRLKKRLAGLGWI